jgi:glucose-1-phosphate adenylyltransferase
MMPTLRDVLGVILGGGRGDRLYPLTRDRAKPAVPIAGNYRLIDIPMSNCINSGITRIAVLTQFNSVSLHRHIARTYIFDPFSRGWVQILAAEQTPRSDAWYQGTADAVRKQLLEIKSPEAPYVLILAGDHLYRMDYSALARFHWENEAEITIAVQPVRRDDATRFGLLKRDSSGRISDFTEKPKDPQVQENFISREDAERPFLGSMGIYLFNTPILISMLESNKGHDFGKEIIPAAIQTHKVFGFDFDGYWEDIGTIRSFYATNLALTHPDSPFNFYSPQYPIYTRPRFLPGSNLAGATLHNVFLADGCRIHRAEIRNSIIGLRSQIANDAHIESSILMGADYYENGVNQNDPPLGIGEGCVIEGAILDKNVRIESNVVIRPFPHGTDITQDDWVVRDGIVVIPKNTTLASGTYIGP